MTSLAAKSLLILAFCLACPSTEARTETELSCISCRYSGAQLVEDYFPRKGTPYSRHVAAWAYIDGVYDASEGSAWCRPRKKRIHADEMAADIAWGLRELPEITLQENAAKLIVAHLRRKFPCPQHRGQV
jgi:hypothetical protein